MSTRNATREKRIKSGLCIRCGRKPRTGKRCDTCKAYDAARRDRERQRFADSPRNPAKKRTE